MQIALVHDWFVTYAGSERVLEQIIELFPDAEIYSIIDFIPENERTFLRNKIVNTSILQQAPLIRNKYRNYLPIMPFAIEQFDLSKYDLIISSSHAVAKGVITGPNQIHISYVHSPMRYAWDLQHQYLRETNLNEGFKSYLVKLILHYMRLWDYRTANGVDYFIANSNFIAKRINKVYRRDATIIYPPVDISAFTLKKQKEDFYLTASRMVPYKKMDLIVDAFKDMPDKRLIVIGDGPDYAKIKAKASSNVELLGYQPFNTLKSYMQRAKAFVFAAEEDFGIIPVEAQACGTPVIAYGKGGGLETVRGLDCSRPTGVFFDTQTVNSLIRAVNLFEKEDGHFKPENCRLNSLQFSTDNFKSNMKAFVQEVLVKHGIEARQ